MLDLVVRLDTALFVFFNQILANPFFDVLMPLVTNGENWVIAISLAVVLLLYNRRLKGLVILLGIVVVFALCDQSSAHWLKPVFKRVRPCHVVDGARVLIGCSGAYALPSAHATNTFGCAVWLSYWFPPLRWVFFGLSAVVSLSRVYVGVHYPLDVLGGWILGGIIGLVAVAVAEGVRRHRRANARPEAEHRAIHES